MTTQAPTRIPEQDEVRAPGRTTAPLSVPAAAPILDSFALLDYRARRRAISDRVAPAGQFLAFLDGEETQLVKLESTITHLGRSLTSDVRFEDRRVSRTHAIIARYGRFHRLLDNRSSNGTYLNGRRVVAANLCHGDVIRIGPLAMQYFEIR
jgi:hypothetical protein